MKQIKQALQAQGWTVSLCNWQAKKGSLNMTTLIECYTISNATETKNILIQQLPDGSTVLFASAPELLNKQNTEVQSVELAVAIGHEVAKLLPLKFDKVMGRTNTGGGKQGRK